MTKKYILELFIHNGVKYYRDSCGFILNETTKIVGYYKKINGEYTYFFVD